MQRGTPEIMGTDPVGHYVSGACFLHFCAAPELWGIILWGRPNMDVARELGRTLVLELEPTAKPHASVVDASRMEGADTGAFQALEWYMRTHGDQLAKQVLKLALVRPPGLSGAIVAGIYDVVPRPYPVEVFGTVGEALAWAGAEDAIEAELVAAHAEATGTPPLLGALRGLLSSKLTGITVAEAAKRMSLSERSLQRKLSELDTTFQAELGAARVRAAQRMLVDTDAPLTNIALEVGCASLQHFSALFRKHVGVAPSAWRKRNK
jgi:transcriptional regulator GlxA family with amidase domain